MALRLTSTSLAADEQRAPASAPGVDHDGVAAHRLAERGASLLAAGDFDGYVGLYAEASELRDPSRRYQARKLLIEQGFNACARAAGGRTTEILVAIVKGALTALDAEPAEPVLLNYAGVALYELWSLDAARAMFAAAQKLDPTLPHLPRNLAECKRRKRATNRPKHLHPALPGLAQRAQRLAVLARPATGKKLSLCMIVRDEEEMLPRCLAAIAPAVDEIIIVDTGSQDRTIEIAKSFGATVIEREWTGSFADARNASFDAATGDWIIYLDADEVLVTEDAGKLRAACGQTWREAFYFVETNFMGAEDDGTAVNHSAMRMFRNRPNYRFEGRLHEQIAQNLPAYLPERLHQTGVRIEHYGYLGVVRDAKEKSRRNIDLLLAQMAESPPSAFLHFNLGSEHFAAGDPRAALAEYEKSWAMVQQDLDAVHEFSPALISRLVKALRACGRHQEAIDRANEGLEQFPGFTDLVFDQAAAAAALGRRDEAVARWEQCIRMGDAPSKYTSLVGCGTYLPRISLAELDLRDGDAATAVKRMRWCIEHHPGFFGIILPFATALLADGADPDAVVAEVEARVPRMTPTVRYMLGTALFENRHPGPATEQFRSVLASHPNNGAARVALAEALLYQRQNAEAAEVAAGIDPEAPLAATALRSELFARIADGDLATAATAFAKAGDVSMPASERAVFGAWLARLDGRTDTEPLPVRATPLLEVMLEALLRVQDFATFETLHPLVATSELPVREQRELLGRIYLRRGFLKSAAREWMAVVETAPDARALVGLAQVSHANGQADAAAMFAAEALKLEPGNAAAGAILDRHRPTPAAA